MKTHQYGRIGLPIVFVCLTLGTAVVFAGPSITKSSSCKTHEFNAKHAVATLFFGSNIRNVVSTNNEFQMKDGFDLETRATDVHFDVYMSNSEKPGTCLGSIDVHIDPNSNQAIQFAVEDHIKAVKGERIGLIQRSGSLDVRKKFDIYVDVMNDGMRRVIWNNFVGLPNKSREMSAMRFIAGQHLAINYSGSNPAGAVAHIQLFRNDGTYIGTAKEKVGPHSVVITDSVRSLSFMDNNGKAVGASSLPEDGGGFLKVQGLNDQESERATVNLYTNAAPNSNAKQPFGHADLMAATITWSRRNAGHDPLPLGK